MTDEWNPLDPDASRVMYDLSMWSFDQQAELAAELADAEIPHTWEGSELVVPETSESAADALVTAVEARLGIVYDSDAGEAHDNPAAIAVDLTPGVPTTEYELDDWGPVERDALSRAFTRQSLPFRWQGDTLLVHTDDEDVAESLMDMVENGEVGVALPVEPDDGEGDELPFETLTTFFLAGERLRRNPLDADGLEQLLQAVDVADPARPPYGVELPLWTRTCDLADQLAGALADGDEPDHELAMETASELYDLLRPYV